MNDTLDLLKTNLDKLPAKDQEFAKSLIAQSERKGLTEKQLYWVDKLATKTIAPPKAEQVAIGNLEPIITMFKTARMHIPDKLPKITLLLEHEGEQPIDLKLGVAKAQAKYPGSINVVERGPFGKARFFGRIHLDGIFQPSGEETPPGLIDLIKELAADPVKVAARHGIATKSCCFCNKTLTDPRSKTVGYGPVCASNFGLSWGEA